MQYHPWLVGMRRAMELMLTGDAMSGREAAEWGFATRSFPLDELEQRTLDFAERAAKVPVELQQLNKCSVHRAMEIMGARAAMRAGTEIQALAFTTEASRATCRRSAAMAAASSSSSISAIRPSAIIARARNKGTLRVSAPLAFGGPRS
jgi:enoyl-CoA hydratase/carnithine racemase